MKTMANIDCVVPVVVALVLVSCVNSNTTSGTLVGNEGTSVSTGRNSSVVTESLSTTPKIVLDSNSLDQPSVSPVTPVTDSPQTSSENINSPSNKEDNSTSTSVPDSGQETSAVSAVNNKTETVTEVVNETASIAPGDDNAEGSNETAAVVPGDDDDNQFTTSTTQLTTASSDSNKSTSSTEAGERTSKSDIKVTTPYVQYDRKWMDYFLRSHHFQGQYSYDGSSFGFDFIVRSVHTADSRTLVTYFHDQDGAVLEMNGTSTERGVIVFKLVRVFTPGPRFPLDTEFEITGSMVNDKNGKYFLGNVTRSEDLTFSWIHMSKSLGLIETGETTGTRTAIIIIIPTTIAFLGICGTVAIICWASKKGYLRGRHKSYRLFTNAQVSYESEAETIHI